MSEGEFEGGCLCGAVRYRATGAAGNATLCHCQTCRRASGAPTVAWVTFAARAFGFTRGDPLRYRSSPLVLRTFCGRCGTPLSYARDDEPESIDVTTISLDRAAELAPRDHTWTRHALPWMRGLDALPHFPEKRSGPRE
ncbi:MAG TPA: GFA family protein [Myxococcota bacterium]|nr:GFA family protein [Myxococcota bacterium]